MAHQPNTKTTTNGFSYDLPKIPPSNNINSN